MLNKGNNRGSFPDVTKTGNLLFIAKLILFLPAKKHKKHKKTQKKIIKQKKGVVSKAKKVEDQKQRRTIFD